MAKQVDELFEAPEAVRMAKCQPPIAEPPADPANQ